VVETTGRPVRTPPRRLDPARAAIAAEEFRKLEKAGIVRRSKSPWASLLHMVPKKDGSWRPCGDYRRLNLATVPDRYPLPNLQDFTAELSGCTWFAKVDLVKGFHQIPVAPQDIPKTAINTPCGLWEYLGMPFGLKNVAQSFQRLMDRLFCHSPGTFGYMNDHLVYGRGEQNGLSNLQQFFEVCEANGLRLNRDKCVFRVSELWSSWATACPPPASSPSRPTWRPSAGSRSPPQSRTSSGSSDSSTSIAGSFQASRGCSSP
jgi:hypothetical protein